MHSSSGGKRSVPEYNGPLVRNSAHTVTGSFLLLKVESLPKKIYLRSTSRVDFLDSTSDCVQHFRQVLVVMEQADSDIAHKEKDDVLSFMEGLLQFM